MMKSLRLLLGMCAIWFAQGCASSVVECRNGACDASMADVHDASTPEDVGDVCTWSDRSTLEDVRLRFTGTRCTFTLAEAAAGIRIPYELVVQRAHADIPVTALDQGRCAQPDSTGLALFEEVGGQSGTVYCRCDQGLCPPSVARSAVSVGVYPRTFEWTGRSWSGPSDTNNPLGPPVQPGSYTIHVRAAGEAAYSMQLEVHIRIVP